MVSEGIGFDDWAIELFSRTPLRVVMQGARKNPETGRLEMERMASVESGDDVLLPVFTEKGLADQYLINGGMPDGKIMAFDKTSEFRKFLSGLDEGSFDGIVFDPGQNVGERISYYPLKQALGILEYLENNG